MTILKVLILKPFVKRVRLPQLHAFGRAIPDTERVIERPYRVGEIVTFYNIKHYNRFLDDLGPYKDHVKPITQKQMSVSQISAILEVDS